MLRRTRSVPQPAPPKELAAPTQRRPTKVAVPEHGTETCPLPGAMISPQGFTIQTPEFADTAKRLAMQPLNELGMLPECQRKLP